MINGCPPPKAPTSSGFSRYLPSIFRHTDPSLAPITQINPKFGNMRSREIINFLVQKHQVMVFLQSNCPYCVKVLEVLKQCKIKFFAIDLLKLDRGSNLIKSLFKITPMTTVPIIFINGELLGGYDDLMTARRSGQLQLQLGYIRDKTSKHKKVKSISSAGSDCSTEV
ncbi:thioredoxin-like protein [Conidiobolus coronatus NRRL 28638]|uniref:Thioredoxin-like protein n=1 Tax=Conidiobolus coronatus (strain ATCC 28846 / CBS 209.66 / NRRL 28638) TaxID=796925 RepID=A0A137NRG4_CONC2|nr:thioredoxin-like protein [Conidiobolus coronatus NRRL 28638]|eukprot:KXN65318.1 thioredoxin-like protein [Conidiobolus coronatus NRRL 28638]